MFCEKGIASHTRPRRQHLEDISRGPKGQRQELVTHNKPSPWRAPRIPNYLDKVRLPLDLTCGRAE